MNPWLTCEETESCRIAPWSLYDCVLFTRAQCRQVLPEQAERAAPATPSLGFAGHQEKLGDLGKQEVKVCTSLLVLLLTRQGFSWGEGEESALFS